jgi:uncharacterized protein
MAGETDLTRLLQSMQPQLQPGDYVFCTVEPTYSNPELQPLGWFREAEGLTLILPRSQADAAGLSYEARFGMITLAVHSSLEAVGFLAAITQRLAEQGISVNPVSAYYHDHLFVSVARIEQAMAILQAMTE